MRFDGTSAGAQRFCRHDFKTSTSFPSVLPESAMPGSVLIDSSWNRVGETPPLALTDARLQLHHAAQIVVSAAISYVPVQADDSHTALTWLPSVRALVSEPIAAATPVRIGVRVEDLTLLALDAGLRPTSSFPLPGRKIADGHAWLADATAEAGLERARLTARKHYTIPSHPVADGAAFSVDARDHLAELTRYWSNAAGVLEELARTTPGATPVRTWPHHFDIATLIVLPTADDARRTIGVGQSPGDDSYAEPYWYVGPYPYPPATNLPALDGGGHWHTKGWMGASLPASAYVAAAEQRAQVAAFIESAVAACRTLLGS
jgi:hypothetical protein